MKHDTSGQLALYIWDYFFCANAPAKGDEKRWAAIERATHRIRESEPHVHPTRPADVRVRNARRVRDAARVALRNIECLSTITDPWVIDGLMALEMVCEALLEELKVASRTVELS